MTSCYIPQLSFSFYRHQPIRADFSGGQITSDAGLLPLRAFDQRYGLTRGLAERVCDAREEERVRHSVLSLFRQRLYQIIAGYEDANDADRLRYDPAFQILADQPLGEPLGSQPTLSRWENSPSPRDLLKLQDALLDWFVKICGKQVRKRGEILLDVDSTDDPTHGQQQLSFFNGGYDQHMYHPLLIFERHTGCLLAARLRPGRVVSHARIIPLLLRIVPKVRIKLRADAGFATPLLYEAAAVPSFPSITIAGNVRTALKNSRMVLPLTDCAATASEPMRSACCSTVSPITWSIYFACKLPLSMRSAQIETLRMQLFKIGARIRETARCIRVHLASGWPFQDLFQAASFCNSS